MLGRSNYLALVGGGRNPAFPQNKVIIWNDDSQRKSSTLEFRSIVKNVRITRNRIIVALMNSVHVYAFSQPPERLHVFDTTDNPRGLVEMSNKHLIFPGRTQGHIQVLDLPSGNVSIIPAHASALAALAISPAGDILASASEQGTLIRVFSVLSGSRIAELRRGSDHAVIYNIAISPASKRLAVTSDKQTLHIFDLPAGAASPGTSPQRASSSAMARAGSSHGPYDRAASPTTENKRLSFLNKLPLLPAYFSSEWSFTSTKFEGKGKGALGWVDEGSVVLVSEGRGEQVRWEKFVLVEGVEGKVEVVREGWRAYLEE